ncbi:hypothetical protein C8F04DRAFT_513306 [Mycena alexandri]|uniref:Fungal-type protein kinase domain-containing protein n=1 Tax=Mycena alexandri TaxID=1745969 RepID=A0AAD6X4V8_9AGAR|nr:hypothetical protein C8F04DRAFT_513306 [Mycena alexandri]
MVQQKMWWKTLEENFRGESSVDEFLGAYMPQPTTEIEGKIEGIVTESASKLEKAKEKAQAAKKEDQYDESLVAYLNAIVAKFPPNTRPWFADTKSAQFPPIDEDDHVTSPDITGGQPGTKPPMNETYTWPDAGLVFELKVKRDIFKAGRIKSDSVQAKSALVQLAKSARSLLASGRSCFVFVVAVDKTMARILCFDRAGFRTSVAFDWTEESNSNVIPTFLWRLYNPDKPKRTSPDRMYGADATISTPTAVEKEEMFKLWQATSSYKIIDKAPSLEEATRHSRWVEAYRDGRPVLCFTIGELLFQSEGLFSRATRVDRVIIKGDPRSSVRVYALKDAWRQVCRRPETDFYAVIAKHCEEKGRPTEGMAQCLGSVEFPDHKTNSAASDEQQRCHMRSLLTPVGVPLKRFRSSKEFILALQNAVEHSRIALEAGVIHRDVSEGNVLFDEETRKGFLVDWDYAEFNANGMANFEKWFSDRADSDKYPDIDKSLKGLTGTFPFMAIQRLEKEDTAHEARHDLESLYWLLIWVILRYTAHIHSDGQFACHELFGANPKKAATLKRDWLNQDIPLSNIDSPLYILASTLQYTVLLQNPIIPVRKQTAMVLPSHYPPPVSPPAEIPLTHETMKHIFTEVITSEVWKTFDDSDSPALPFVRPRIAQEESQHQSKTAPSQQLRRLVVENNARSVPSQSDGSAGASGSESRKRGRDAEGDDAAVSVASTSVASSVDTDMSETTPRKKKAKRAPAPAPRNSKADTKEKGGKSRGKGKA